MKIPRQVEFNLLITLGKRKCGSKYGHFVTVRSLISSWSCFVIDFVGLKTSENIVEHGWTCLISNCSSVHATIKA